MPSMVFPYWMSRKATRVFFMAWRLLVELHVLHLSTDDDDDTVADGLHRPVTTDNIWRMRKVQLMEVVKKELHWTADQAQEARVGQLRLYIREAREERSLVVDGRNNAWRRPIGLTRMKHADLVVEARSRGLDVDKCNKKMKTREEILRDIEAHIKMCSGAASSSTPPS